LNNSDIFCKTIGIGFVHKKRLDYKVRKMTHFKNVPELKKSLMSIGVLDMKNFICNVKGEVMHIKGSSCWKSWL